MEGNESSNKINALELTLLCFYEYNTNVVKNFLHKGKNKFPVFFLFTIFIKKFRCISYSFKYILVTESII